MVTRVGDMTIDEFRTLIRETVTQTLTELLYDPDDGLELRNDLEKALKSSITAVKSGEKTIAAEEVASKLGLNW